MTLRSAGLWLLLVFSVSAVWSQDRPRLVFTAADIREIREARGSYPLFDAAWRTAQETADRAVRSPIDVPMPKDAAGYTHERHKQNYTEMYLAGLMHAVTGEERYARFVRDMLRKYAELYPKLGEHPARAGESPGRIFWQTLNESVWLVHTAQAFDFVHAWLTPADRALFESALFRPMTRFFTVDNGPTLDRVHNHGAWTAAAVGMTGFALRDTNLVALALYGTKKDRTGGFLRQIDGLFSPDGYYAEGPYYARYALTPFLNFAQAIEANLPGLKIFGYRENVLVKAVSALLQQTNSDGRFFPINDAMKEKSYFAPEAVLAVDAAYHRSGGDSRFLSVARIQNRVVLSPAGLAVARALASAPSVPPFPYASLILRDGPDGASGGLGILRAGALNDQMTVLLKYTAHGMSHGHFDKLNLVVYDAGFEILQDYGAARFVNVDPKYGGRYLPESKSFAMQTIAHNTVTVDGQSHYGGKIAVAERHHPDHRFSSLGDQKLQYVSAECGTAVPGVMMERTLVVAAADSAAKPVLIDLFVVRSDSMHRYDLPYYTMGQMLATSVPSTYHGSEQRSLGVANGYQHLWKEAEGKPGKSFTCSWLQGNRYYTVTGAADSSMSVLFVRTGANDPSFNLRHEGGFILRAEARTHVFVSVLEPHGIWDGTAEISRDPYGSVASVAVAAAGTEGTAVDIRWKNGRTWRLLAAGRSVGPDVTHRVTGTRGVVEWTGNLQLIK